MNDADSLGMQPTLHPEDDEDVETEQMAVSEPLFMWSPQADRGADMLVVAVGEKSSVFASTITAMNGWGQDVVVRVHV